MPEGIIPRGQGLLERFERFHGFPGVPCGAPNGCSVLLEGDAAPGLRDHVTRDHVTRDHLATSENVEGLSDLKSVNPDVHDLTHNGGWDAVRAAGETNVTIGVHFPDEQLPSVVLGNGRGRSEHVDLTLVPVDGFLLGGAVNPDVRDGVDPRIQLAVEILERGEAAADQERVLHVLHARFDLPLRARPIRWACHRERRVVLAEVQERPVEAHLFAGDVLIHRGFHVVHQQLLRNTEHFESLPETRQEDRHPHAGGEPSEQHPGEPKDHHEHIKLAAFAVDQDGSALTPIDLRLPARLSFEPLDHKFDLLAFDGSHEVLHDGQPARIPHRLNLLKETRHQQIELRQASLQVRLERIEFRSPGPAAFGAYVVQDVVHGLPADAVLLGDQRDWDALTSFRFHQIPDLMCYHRDGLLEILVSQQPQGYEGGPLLVVASQKRAGYTDKKWTDLSKIKSPNMSKINPAVAPRLA